MTDRTGRPDEQNGGYRIEIPGACNSAIVTWYGELTESHFLSFMEELRQHLKFRRNLNRLYDFRQISLKMGMQDFRAIFQKLKDDDPAHGHRKVAFLVAEDLHFGLLRMFSAIAEPLAADMAVFRDAKPALEWVSLPAGFMD